jgi:hypothetical protein
MTGSSGILTSPTSSPIVEELQGLLWGDVKSLWERPNPALDFFHQPSHRHPSPEIFAPAPLQNFLPVRQKFCILRKENHSKKNRTLILGRSIANHANIMNK